MCVMSISQTSPQAYYNVKCHSKSFLFGEPDKEVHQVDNIRNVVKDHPQVVSHVPENWARNDKEDIVEDGDGYHLWGFFIIFVLW